ncbi:hypothetical protein N9L68_08005 [bacterium]|nr:hypothetical protein [bacterium]
MGGVRIACVRHMDAVFCLKIPLVKWVAVRAASVRTACENLDAAGDPAASAHNSAPRAIARRPKSSACTRWEFLKQVFDRLWTQLLSAVNGDGIENGMQRHVPWTVDARGCGQPLS